MTQASEELLRRAETFELKAKNARKTECSFEVHTYWRGYGEACDEAAASFRALANKATPHG